MNLIKTYLLVTIFALWPFASFIGNNMNKGVMVAEAIMLYAIFLVITLAFLTLILAAPGARSKKVHSVICFSVLFFYFSAISDLSIETGQGFDIALWTVSTMVLVFLTWKLTPEAISNRSRYAKYIGAILVSLYLLPAWQVFVFLIEKQLQTEATTLQGDVNFNNVKLKKKPNIYYIVLDGFGRSDVLKNQLGYDNSVFIKELERHGFFVADESFANYPLTYLSIAAALDMRYILEEGPNTLKNRSPFYLKLRGDNRFVNFLKSRGYTYVHFHNFKWAGTICDMSADTCVKEVLKASPPFLRLSETESTLLKLTPVYSPIKRFLAERELKFYEDNSEPVQFQLGKLQHWVLGGDVAKTPFFAFVHVLSPHPPNEYGKSCEKVKGGDEFQKWNTKQYIQQVRCVQRDLLEVVDAISEADRNDPIIVVQGDHGPAINENGALFKNFEELNGEDFNERYGILNAIKSAESCQQHLYPGISPVNTFRAVISCLGELEPSFLPDKSYSAYYEDHPDYGQTKRIR